MSKELPISMEEVEVPKNDLERVLFWKTALKKLALAKKNVEEAEGFLVKRAIELKPSLKESFTVDPPHSRQITIDGSKAGKVVVEKSAVFEVIEDIGIDAKKALMKWCNQTRAANVREIGEDRMQILELLFEIQREVGDQKDKAKLTKSAANALRAIRLPKHTSEFVRVHIAKVVKALQPLKGKFSVKEAK